MVLAQPFRYLAHNGEINTITANRNWALARTPKFENPLLPGLTELNPIVNRTGSDSSSLDNMLEILVGGGMDLFRALRMLVPPAWQNVETLDADLRAFYEFNSKHMEAWDGPAYSLFKMVVMRFVCLTVMVYVLRVGLLPKMITLPWHLKLVFGAMSQKM